VNLAAPCFWVRVPYEGHVEVYAQPAQRTPDDLARYAVWLNHDSRLADLLRRALDLVDVDA
jgi:hypothetical protein